MEAQLPRSPDISLPENTTTTFLVGDDSKQGEKLAQAPAREICSAGQCGQNRRCFQGDPVSCFFLGKGVIVKTFLLRGLQKLVFQNIL